MPPYLLIPILGVPFPVYDFIIIRLTSYNIIHQYKIIPTLLSHVLLYHLCYYSYTTDIRYSCEYVTTKSDLQFTYIILTILSKCLVILIHLQTLLSHTRIPSIPCYCIIKIENMRWFSEYNKSYTKKHNVMNIYIYIYIYIDVFNCHLYNVFNYYVCLCQ